MPRTRHVLLPALAVLAIPVTSFVLAGDLPSPVARHWGATGVADGSSPLWVSTLLVAVVAGGIAASSLLAVRAATDTPMARGLVATAHAIAVGSAALHAATLVAQRGLDDWRASELTLSTVLLALLVPGLVAGVVGWLVARDIVVSRDDDALPADLIEIAPGEAVLWSGRTGATWAPIAGGVIVVLAALVHLGSGAETAAVPILVVAGMLVAVAGRASVTVGPNGLRVRGGVLPVWPRVDVPLEDIAAVRVEEVATLSYGGLGYRVRPGVRAIVTWPGEALRVERRDGAAVVVTVPGARTAAGVLAAHLAADPSRGS